MGLPMTANADMLEHTRGPGSTSSLSSAVSRGAIVAGAAAAARTSSPRWAATATPNVSSPWPRSEAQFLIPISPAGAINHV